MNGFLNLNKPLGITSHTAVARVRRLVGRGVKVGHAGTLDPAATGVLPLALGQATRLVEYLTDTRKSYRATVRLGATTTTDDAEGEIVAERPVPPLDAAMLEQALESFRGTIQQIPPMYSALHHQGQRLYNLARAGETVERAAREVTMYKIELEIKHLNPEGFTKDVGYPFNGPRPLGFGDGWGFGGEFIILDIECSKGTYIRALARDLGEALGCGAHLAALERTAVGEYMIADAVDLATLESNPARIDALLLPMESAVADWPALFLDEQQVALVRNGRSLRLYEQPGERVRVHRLDGTLLALMQRSGDAWQPEKVFVH